MAIAERGGRADWNVWSANHNGQKRDLEGNSYHARVFKTNLRALGGKTVV